MSEKHSSEDLTDAKEQPITSTTENQNNALNMSEKHSSEDLTDAKEQPITSTTENQNNDAGSEDSSSQKRFSSFGSLLQVKDTNKRLPTIMKKIIQVEFKNTLLEIQEELQEFIMFVEDVQKNTPSEWEVITVTPLQTELSPNASSDENKLEDIQNVDPRPSNAPIRDAFQIVRNLLSKIAILIDKIAFTATISDDCKFDESSPHYSIYYAEYVFQIACFVLKMIGEHLNKFGEIVGEASMKGLIDENPIMNDNIVRPNPHLFLRRKDPNYCPVTNHSADYAMASTESKNNQRESNLETTPNLSESKLRDRISDGIELLKFLSERFLSSLEESEFINFDKNQEMKKPLNENTNHEHKEQEKSQDNYDENKLNISIPPKSGNQVTFNNKDEDFHENEFSAVLKEDLKKKLTEYSNKLSENPDYAKTSAILNLIIQSFRETAGEEDVEDNTEIEVDNSPKSVSFELTEEEREKQLDDVVDVFVNETYKFTLMSLSGMRMTDAMQPISKKIQKADTDPTPIAIAEKVIPLGRPKSSSELQDRTGIQEIKECSSCPQTVQFKMSDYYKEKPKDLFPLKDSDDANKRSACDEECLKGKLLHEKHDILPKGKMEVRQVNDRGRVVIVLEDYDDTAGHKELINCTALLDLRQGQSRMDMEPAIRSTNILKAMMLNISSSRKVDDKYLMQTTSHSCLTPIKILRGTTHGKAAPDISEIVEKMWDLGESLRNAGYGSGPPLVLKLRSEKVYEEAFKTLIVPSGIPLSYYQKILFHIYERSDESGVEDMTDEMFPVLGENVFRSVDGGLFNHPTDHSMFVYPNPASKSLLEGFRFAGILLAVAIIQNEYLGVKLPLCFYRCLLDRPLILHDLKEIDPILHQKLMWLNENNISGRNTMFYFTIQEKVGKESIVSELIEGGKKVSVTENNKMLFIEKCLKRKIVERCLVQYKELISGFTSVLEPRFLDKFKEEEIQRMIEKCPCLYESEEHTDYKNEEECKLFNRRGTF